MSVPTRSTKPMGMPWRILRFAFFAVLAWICTLPALAAPTISTLGTPMSAPPTLYGPGWDIGGGGTDVDAAMQWLVNYVRGGASSSNKIDIVVLRCSGTDGYNSPWYALTGVNSITTVVGTSTSDFNDSKVSTLVHNAGVVFLAGGDQATYVNTIKGTATDTAIKYVLSHGGGIGGTSAGTAVQGPMIFDSIAADAAGGTNVASADALSNPYESTISFTYGWFAWSHFENVLCEPHFGPTSPDTSNKDRMGRIMAFLARQVQDGRSAAAWGMCVNAGTSLVVDKNGLATVMGTGTSGDGIAYMVQLDHLPETCKSGTPLTCSGFKIWMLTEGQTFDLAHRPTCNYYLGSVTGGSLDGSYYTQGSLVTNCDTAPTITAQPASQTVGTGQSATFSVVATGTSLSYQWRRNGTSISGATSASYTLAAASTSDNGAVFSVEVSNAAGSVTSSNATLSVANGPVAPTITTQPASQSVALGQTATFTVSASGTSPLAYQWRKNGTAISGATSASYTTPAITNADNGALFSVVVSNSAGSATSANATLNVGGNPPNGISITSQPANSSVSSGATATFSVSATGSAYTQWFRNGLAISGATSSSYTTPATTSADNGARFFAVVSSTSDGLASSSATLSVNGGGTTTDLITNGGFENGSTGWVATSGVIGAATSSEPAYEGSYRAYICGRGRTYTDSVYQAVTIPSTISTATLSFYLHIDTAETGSTSYDTLQVQIRSTSGSVLKTLATYSNTSAASGYAKKTLDVSAYKGQSIQVCFLGTENSSKQTSFVVDNVSLTAQ